ncbi:alpha-amylase [Chitinophaga costaii]|nr:alpha-amylase [Chitinophaga costaii]
MAAIWLLTIPVAQAQGTMENEAGTTHHKLIIYQLLVRLYGNKTTQQQFYGSAAQNGVGKFNDITDKALDGIKQLGVSHVWFTGVLEHASMADYSSYGIPPDDPVIVKGRAGSPYAVRDYYDVDPDLAVSVPDRMAEWEALIARTHAHDLKVIMDFVPNHVARHYYSDAKPAGVKDFGEMDNNSVMFSPGNDFYYVPGQSLVVPGMLSNEIVTLCNTLPFKRYVENPAKATGNNIFSATPSVNDWYETVKLNYGINYQNNQQYFDPIPPVWEKMRDILLYWTNKHVDAFRCDMAEMVPVAFWSWVIPQVKKVNPDIKFIAEAYNPSEYTKYLNDAHFDYLYDKVGLYDALKRLIRDDSGASVQDIGHVLQSQQDIDAAHLVRFLENHDEERVASPGFAGNAWHAIPAMVACATLGGGPVMIYFGQEEGEKGAGIEGFGGEDGRTTIFDYWNVPAHQAWMNNGAFDGGMMTADERNLRNFYATLLNIAAGSPAIRDGAFQELADRTGFNNKQCAYLRTSSTQELLVVLNFDHTQTLDTQVAWPAATSGTAVRELLTGQSFSASNTGHIPVKLAPYGAAIFELSH